MRNELVEAVKRYTEQQAGSSPFATSIEGLTNLRSDHPKPPRHLIFKPSLCVVVQGAKWAVFGDKRLEYRAGQALVVSMEIPAFGTVYEASPAEPYLGVILELDLGWMRETLEQLAAPPAPESTAGRGVFVSDFSGPLEECVLRMVRLLATPRAVPMLAPAIMREICYWLLTGPDAGAVIGMTALKSHTRSVVSAIHLLRDRFAEPVRMEELASAAGMSASAFHRRFRQITSMTPLQYQKQLRLQEARRLMVAEELNVETAAFQVGYESASQFSREYARMFGRPPRRDVVSLRSTAA